MTLCRLLLALAIASAASTLAAEVERLRDPEYQKYEGGILLAPEVRLFREKRRLLLESLKEVDYRSSLGEHSFFSTRQKLGQELAWELAMLLRSDSQLPGPIDERLLSHLLGFDAPTESPGVKLWQLVPPLEAVEGARRAPEVGDWVVEFLSEPPFGRQVVIRFKETGGFAAMKKAEAETPLPGTASDAGRLWLLRSYAKQTRLDREQYAELLGSLSAMENKKEMMHVLRGMSQLFRELEASQVASLMRMVDAGILLKGARFEPVRLAFNIDNSRSGWHASMGEPGLKRYALKLAWDPDSWSTGWKFEVITRLPQQGQDETVESCCFVYEVD